MAKADIRVRDKDYSVACAPGQEGRLVELANEFDRRVGHIAQAVGDIGDQRLFLIAALALLDELHAANQGIATMSGPDLNRAASALEGAADRLTALASKIEAEL